MKLATSVVAISHSLATSAARETGVLGITVIGEGSSNGVNLEQYHRRSSAAEVEARKRVLGIPLGAHVLGFVGRITLDKGLDDLLASAEGLARDGHPIHLVLVGEREDSSPFEADLKRISRFVTETGQVDDPASYLELVDIFIMPSRREGFCNAILEAAAMEVPVVAARSTGIVDAVQDGVTGLLFEPHDVAELNELVLSLLNDPALRRSLTQAGKNRVEEHFERSKVRLAYVRHLEHLLHE